MASDTFVQINKHYLKFTTTDHQTFDNPSTSRFYYQIVLVQQRQSKNSRLIELQTFAQWTSTIFRIKQHDTIKKKIQRISVTANT